MDDESALRWARHLREVKPTKVRELVADELCRLVEENRRLKARLRDHVGDDTPAVNCDENLFT